MWTIFSNCYLLQPVMSVKKIRQKRSLMWQFRGVDEVNEQIWIPDTRDSEELVYQSKMSDSQQVCAVEFSGSDVEHNRGISWKISQAFNNKQPHDSCWQKKMSLYGKLLSDLLLVQPSEQNVSGWKTGKSDIRGPGTNKCYSICKGAD